MPLPTFRVELTENEQITPKVHKLIFKFVEPQHFTYIPGQFVSFILPHEGDKPLKRSYSIANLEQNSENTQYLEIVVAYVEGGKATEFFFNAQPGIQIDITGPFGLLYLPKELPKRVFLVGTGTGVAPYRCMLNQLNDYPDTEFHILFGAQYEEDMFYLNDFKQAAQKENIFFHPCLSKQDPLPADCSKGYVQHKLESLTPNAETDLVYLCGNPNMVDDVFNLLKDKEFGVKQVKREKYVFSKY